MKRLLGSMVVLALLVGGAFAVPPPPHSPESVPIGPLAIPLIAAGAVGYGVYKLIKK
jgi:hypothetical protein